MDKTSPLRKLLETLPQMGQVKWIGVRPSRDEPMTVRHRVLIDEQTGLEGDRFSGGANNPRQVTLIQQEHLAVVASCVGRAAVPPELLRRNIVIAGINLLALKDKHFQLGEVQLEYTGLCHPCSKMERLLGPGGYNAMRGHGGITARVIHGGLLELGDQLIYDGKITDPADRVS